MTIVPCTLAEANAFVKQHHRHHAPIPGGFSWWCCAAVKESQVAGVAIAGRPTNRNNDDGQTIEVLRVATDGTFNAPSMLLGACAKAARSIGARRIITYTLSEETGASLRGAGWQAEKENITSWWTHKGKRTPAVDREHMSKHKTRWARNFRLKQPINWPPEDEVQTLFTPPMW